jgi:hypothetical protein
MIDDAQHIGEATCLLPQLDGEGNVRDPRRLIRIEQRVNASDAQLRVVIDAGQRVVDDPLFSDLVPRSKESLEEYRLRLDSPPCRTAAWKMALLTEGGPVTLQVWTRDHEDVFVVALLSYLRSLIS